MTRARPQPADTTRQLAQLRDSHRALARRFNRLEKAAVGVVTNATEPCVRFSGTRVIAQCLYAALVEAPEPASNSLKRAKGK